MVNQMYKMHSRKFNTWKIKNTKDTETNELIRALNKQQSETANTINREINELKMKIENIKEEVMHDMENLRKKKK
jgi:N-acetylmuramic acid 6-phosphate (MurNAc-6-P) etherase